jgi:hypothetical protein
MGLWADVCCLVRRGLGFWLMLVGLYIVVAYRWVRWLGHTLKLVGCRCRGPWDGEAGGPTMSA